jgi:toxin FitB
MMYLIDTNVISERRKGRQANPGVVAFFNRVAGDDLFLSAITLGELRRGIQLIRHRRDFTQADDLEHWLADVVVAFANNVVAVDAEIAQLWGRLRVPQKENELDKLIAASTLYFGLIVVTRNVKDFTPTGVLCENPFTS